MKTKEAIEKYKNLYLNIRNRKYEFDELQIINYNGLNNKLDQICQELGVVTANPIKFRK